MTHLVNAPEDFADEALSGFVAAHSQQVRQVHGGVVRTTRVPNGEVAVVIGGGTGHYPAFAGWVGTGLAHGAACGNIFASPSASQVYSVLKAAHHGGGVFVSFGNYAGDVLHFGQAAARLRDEGVNVCVLAVTDDIASAPPDQTSSRRGIAGDLVVFKVAGAAAAEGASLHEVERVARKANDRTRSLGVAFSGCSLPAAPAPLFTVPDGVMGLGLGIHGEPGIQEIPLSTADAVAELLVERVLAERVDGADRIAVLCNGLGAVKYEELFVAYRKIAELLAGHGYEIVDPEVGEQCTSLDMAGLSLTVTWLDDELERLWSAPCDSHAFRRGCTRPVERSAPHETVVDETVSIPDSSAASRALAVRITAALGAVAEMLADSRTELGRIDAVAGDGDHGMGMARGARAAHATAMALVEQGAGARFLLRSAADAWAERAGGTSGALWGAGLSAVADFLDDSTVPGDDIIDGAARAAVDAIGSLGGAVVGEKTMIDAAIPFLEALGSGVVDARTWHTACAAARAGAESTARFAAKRGRARTHADRSIGTPDPGAVSFAWVVETLGAHLFPPR